MGARTRTGIAALLLVGLLAACSGADMDAASDEGAAEEPASASGGDAVVADGDEAAREESADDSGSDGGGGEIGGQLVQDSAPAGRQLARSARIEIEVEDVDRAAAQVASAASRVGGFVADAQVRGGEDGFGVLTLRVPAEGLDQTVADLADLGVRVLSQSVATEDVTDQLTDVAARLRNLEALETQLLELLEQVQESDPSASELLVVFDRINQVRGEIERLEARQSAVRDRVALATVTVELVPPRPGALPGDGVLAEAWAATQRAFGVLGEIAVWAVVTVLPVAVAVLALPAALVWFLVTRRSRDTDPTSGPAPDPVAASSPPPPAT